jgi:hypothetical protein
MNKYSDNLEALNAAYRRLCKIQSELNSLLGDIEFNPILQGNQIPHLLQKFTDAEEGLNGVAYHVRLAIFTQKALELA